MASFSRRTALLVSLFSGSFPLFATSLIGRVYSDEDRPVEGVVVSAQATKVTPDGLPRNQTVTDVQGKFTFDLKDGDYSICVFSDHRGLLNSCEWDLDHSIVTVQSPLTQFKIILKNGVTMRIRLNDPSRVLTRGTAAANDAAVNFIVWDALGHSHYVREVGGDDKGKNLELLVPPGAQLRLGVDSRNVDVLDKNGAAASKSSVAVSAKPVDLGDTRVYQVVPAAVDKGKSGQ